jgi:hypothetical protein
MIFSNRMSGRYCNGPDVPDAHTAPVGSYPSLEKLAIYNSCRVRVPISLIRGLSLDVVVDQICNNNRLFALIEGWLPRESSWRGYIWTATVAGRVN